MKDFAGYTGGGVPDDLLKEAQAAAAQYDAFGAQFAPMLDAGKRKKLMKLAAELKKM